jgi:hypothetical protein
MWWKLSGLACIELTLLWWLSRPIPTHAVLYDPANPPRLSVLPLWMQITAYVAIAAAFLIPLLAYRIVKKR